MEKIKYNGIDEVVYYERLSNGIDVYMYPNETSKNFYLTFNVKFGSMNTEFKYENEKKFRKAPNGTAHFLEHQLFQEGKGHTAFETFSSLGSSVNAFTTYNLTCYEVIASNNFKENLECLLNFVQNPVFTKESVDKERGIIKEEIKMYDNNPNARLNYGLEYNLNKNDKHKYLISGTIEDIKNITPDTLYESYDAFYQPSNMFIVLSGKFKPLEALGIIKKNQSLKEFKPYKKVIAKKAFEPAKIEKPYEKIEMDVSAPKIKLAYKMSKKSFKGYDDLTLRIYLDAILTIKFGATSDFLEKCHKENLITWDILTSREIRDDYVLLTLTLESEYPEEVLELIREEMSNIKITVEEIKRVSKVNIANFILHFNDIVTVTEDIQDDIISYEKIEENILNIYKNLNEKTANDIVKKIDLTNEAVYLIENFPKV